MTDLQAVNLILRGVGLAGVSALDTDGSSNASQAERVLDEVELEIQSRGWYYNTRYDVTLTPDGSDHILLPTGVITIDSDQEHEWRHVTQVGGSLYDIDNNTDEFDGDIKVQYVLRYRFGCIPQPIQQYIACAAAVIYNDRYGHPSRARGLMEAERSAKAHARRFNLDTSDLNVVLSNDADMVRGRRRQYDW